MLVASQLNTLEIPYFRAEKFVSLDINHDLTDRKTMSVVSLYSRRIPHLPVALTLSQIHRASPLRFISSTSPSWKTKPSRPEPLGEIKAHFPREQETQHLTETKETYKTRWKQYLRDLSSSAAPQRIAGRSFGSRVRGVKLPEEKPRLGKRERTIQKQIERYGNVIEVKDDEEKGVGISALCICSNSRELMEQ